MSYRKKLWFLLHFSCLFLNAWQSRPSRISSSFAGRYRVKLEEFVDCNLPNTKSDVIFYLGCSEYKAEKDCKFISGNITINRDFDDGPMVTVMYPWRDREWKRDSIVMKFTKGFKACNEMVIDVCSNVLRNQTNLKQGVVPVSTPVRVQIPSIPIFPYGRWKTLFYAVEEPDAYTFCLGTVLNIVPLGRQH